MKRSPNNPTRVLLPATVVMLTLLLAINMIMRHWMPTTNDEPDERAIADHRELKELTLELVNERRSRSGVPPVELGNNPVAQIHAEHAAQGCHASHWDEWGLKPQHRYALSGGDQAVSENIFAYGPCREFTDHEAAAELDPETAVRDAVRQLAASTPHLRTMTNRRHTTMHTGISIHSKRVVVVQLFSGNHVKWVMKPTIEDRILRMGGTLENTRHQTGDPPLIEIEHHPAPDPLSKGQLARTGCVPDDDLAAVILQPPPPGNAYRDPESGEAFTKRTRYWTKATNCRDPYATPVDVPPPTSWHQAKQLHEETTSQHQPEAGRKHSATAIVARNLTISWWRKHFSATADLRELINETGPGIYTIVIHATPEGESAAIPVARYPIFVDAAPPPEHPYATNPHETNANASGKPPGAKGDEPR